MEAKEAQETGAKPEKPVPFAYPAAFLLERVPAVRGQQPAEVHCGDASRLYFEIDRALGDGQPFKLIGHEVMRAGVVMLTVKRKGGLAGVVAKGRPDADKTAASKPSGQRKATKSKKAKAGR